MADLPALVADYLRTLASDAPGPAYLLAGPDGRLLAWGGQLARYGLAGLRRGEPVATQLYFLEGLLPLEGATVVLSCVKTGDGVCADIHAFAGEGSDWIVLLDARAAEAERQAVQQAANEARLHAGRPGRSTAPGARDE